MDGTWYWYTNLGSKLVMASREIDDANAFNDELQYLIGLTGPACSPFGNAKKLPHEANIMPQISLLCPWHSNVTFFIVNFRG